MALQIKKKKLVWPQLLRESPGKSSASYFSLECVWRQEAGENADRARREGAGAGLIGGNYGLGL